MTSESDQNNGATETSGAENNGQQTFTQDEVNKMMQERLSRAKKTWEKEQADLAEANRKKAEEDALEGEAKLNKKHQNEIEALAKERDTYARELRIAKAEAQLASKGLDTEFAKMLVGADEDETTENVTKFSQMVEKQVAQRVKDGLHTGAPPAGKGEPQDDLKARIYAGFGLKS